MFNPNRPRPFIRPAAPDPVVAEPVRPAKPLDGPSRAVALITSTLDGQAALYADDRNTELIDVLLDLKNILTVPVVPGRSS